MPRGTSQGKRIDLTFWVEKFSKKINFLKKMVRTNTTQLNIRLNQERERKLDVVTKLVQGQVKSVIDIGGKVIELNIAEKKPINKTLMSRLLFYKALDDAYDQLTATEAANSDGFMNNEYNDWENNSGDGPDL